MMKCAIICLAVWLSAHPAEAQVNEERGREIAQCESNARVQDGLTALARVRQGILDGRIPSTAGGCRKLSTDELRSLNNKEDDE